MNYLTDPIKELEVCLVATDDEYYEENETEGILSVDTEKRRFCFTAKGKTFRVKTEFELFELEMGSKENEITIINLHTTDYFYSFVEKEAMYKAIAPMLALAEKENES